MVTNPLDIPVWTFSLTNISASSASMVRDPVRGNEMLQREMTPVSECPQTGSVSNSHAHLGGEAGLPSYLQFTHTTECIKDAWMKNRISLAHIPCVTTTPHHIEQM